MLSTASARIAAAVVLAGFLPGVKADCWVNSYVSSFPSYLSYIRQDRFPLNVDLSLFLLSL